MFESLAYASDRFCKRSQKTSDGKGYCMNRCYIRNSAGKVIRKKLALFSPIPSTSWISSYESRQDVLLARLSTKRRHPVSSRPHSNLYYQNQTAQDLMHLHVQRSSLTTEEDQ